MYQDMRTGVINLMGIRNVQLGDNQGYYSDKGRYTISIQYKGMSNTVYNYEDIHLRNLVFEEIRSKLCQIKSAPNAMKTL